MKKDPDAHKTGRHGKPPHYFVFLWKLANGAFAPGARNACDNTGRAKAGEERRMLSRDVCASDSVPLLAREVACHEFRAWNGLRGADRSAFELTVSQQSVQNALTDTSDNVYFVVVR